jgi:hypothetical protein
VHPGKRALADLANAARRAAGVDDISFRHVSAPVWLRHPARYVPASRLALCVPATDKTSFIKGCKFFN